MPVMTVKSFLDTNIVLYTIGQDTHKKTVARQLVASGPMVSSQVINDCDTLYSEDMQHGQLFENSLKVINPFA